MTSFRRRTVFVGDTAVCVLAAEGGAMRFGLRLATFVVLATLATVAAAADGAAPPQRTIEQKVQDAQRAAERGQAETEQQLSAGERTADAMNHILGTGVSPVFGMALLGAWDHLRGNPRAGWTASPFFYVPLLIVLLAIVLKDVFGVGLGPAKQFIDAFEVAANKVAGVLGLIVSMFYAAQSFGLEFGTAVAQAYDGLVPSAYAAGGGAVGHYTAWSAIGAVFAAIIAGVIYVTVWLTGHAYTILVFLNPFSPLDPFLKGFRAGFIVLVAVLTALAPVLGAFVCLIYFIFAWFTAGYFFRFGLYGSVMSWDLVFRRGSGNPHDPRGVLCFADAALPGVPIRTLGRLSSVDGQVRFTYRPMVVLRARTVQLPSAIGLRSGLLHSTLYRSVKPVADVAQLPPRYRGHDDALAARFAVAERTKSVLVRGWQGVVGFFRSLFRTSPATSA